MSLATTYCRAANGVQAPLVNVEVHLANGLPAFNIVGLPEKAVQESRDRVRSALINAGFEFPARRITVNLAPADLPKEGGRFDLAIAIGVLAASGQTPSTDLHLYEFVGELGLSGEIRPIRGALPVAISVRDAQRILVLPEDNLPEAALIQQARLAPARQILDVHALLSGQMQLSDTAPIPPHRPQVPEADLADVRGQPLAKRALEIAAAGGHNLIFIGPPGSGKSMLAIRLPGILPPLTEEEALETAAIQSISHQGINLEQFGQRPFRHPHHTASGVALVGGGSQPRPGEISLAHNGVLFLDELPEFDRRVLEVLREPLESGQIVISRAARQAEFPANFQLLAAMNPCPCGYHGSQRRSCRCTEDQVHRYRSKISGPLLDRIDMHVEVPSVPIKTLSTNQKDQEEPSSLVRLRVTQAREKQLSRQGRPNHLLESDGIKQHCRLNPACDQLLQQAAQRLGLSGRAFHRIHRVARTAADLEDSSSIELPHLTEAIGYRRLDRT